MYRKSLAGLFLLALSSIAWADSGILIGTALTAGGDDVASYDVQYRGGGGDRKSLKAGGLLLFYAGGYYDFIEQENQDIGVQVNLGYQFDEINAENGDATFSRVSLEFIPYVRLEKIRLGLGLVRHQNVEFDDSTGTGFDKEFDDAIGVIFTADYRVAPKVELGLRLVSIDYELKSVGNFTVNSGEKLDGSHIGIGATLLF